MARQPKIDRKIAMKPKPNSKSGENPYLTGGKPKVSGAKILPLTYVTLRLLGEKSISPYQQKQERIKKK